MEIAEIEEDECIKDFLRSRLLRKSSKKLYMLHFKGYFFYHGKTPSAMIEEAEDEQDSGIKTRKRKIKNHIYDYIDHLKAENKSAYTIKNRMDIITSFYRHFDIQTPRINGLTPKNDSNPAFDELPDTDLIKDILKHCSIRDRAIILLHLSSGMGASEVRELKCSDFVNAMDEYITLDDNQKDNIFLVAQNLKKHDALIGTWQIKRFKTRMTYITFSTPEASKAIIDYILDRYKMNKLITSLDDPLFVSQYNTKLKSRGYNKIFVRHNDRLGLGKRSNGRHFFTSHMLRKLFTTTLYSAGIDKTRVDWMLGHKVGPITEAYFKTNVEDLKANYIKAVPDLTLEKVKVRRMESDEVKSIVRELDKKDGEIQTIKEDQKNKDEEMAKMSKKIDLLEGLVKDLLIEEENKAK